ncbi:hypothetical protein Zmor_014494 [Zophobas morio]|uniref:Uncharacterized protein n=1 Tax=Zophobas morio TaxID=2755281 RepID=A0AA38IG27_9CUCU|nr:hypothetical protein Zmor_014494 [Zophobas morio]
MWTTVFLGIVAVLSSSVRGQLPNLLGSENFERSLEESYSEENELYPEMHYDDDVWLELEYKVLQLLNSDDYESDEKSEDVRGIPTSHKAVSCLEKLDGPFYTIESTSSDEHIYPARYFNISCVRNNDAAQHHGHHKKLIALDDADLLGPMEMLLDQH